MKLMCGKIKNSCNMAAINISLPIFLHSYRGHRLLDCCIKESGRAKNVKNSNALCVVVASTSPSPEIYC